MALVPLLAVLVLAGAVALAVGVVRRSPPSREASVAAARQHARLAAVAAVALGAAAALVTAAREAGNHAPGALGATALLVPIVFGVAHTVVLAVGEPTWPGWPGGVPGLLTALAALVVICVRAPGVPADHPTRV